MKAQTNPNEETHNLRSALWTVALVGAVLTLGSPLVFGFGIVLSVALGAGLAVANLWAITRIVRSVFSPANGGRSPWALIALVKSLLLFGLLLLLLKSGQIKVLPLMLGYSALPLGIVLSELRPNPTVREEG